MKTDIEIAQEARMKPITQIAAQLGLEEESVIPYGRYKAKIDHRLIHNAKKQGKLILVTAISPTPAGEGKTTTTIALIDALNKRGIDATAVLRQPSMGITAAGSKGGASGGGKASLTHPELIDWGLCGEMGAIEAAQNLLVSFAEKAIDDGKLDTILVPRVSEVPSRSLRSTAVDYGKGNVPEKVVLTPTCELMQIVVLSRSMDEISERVSKMIAGTKDGKAVTFGEFVDLWRITGILADAVKPAKTETVNGSPVYVHAGPFHLARRSRAGLALPVPRAAPGEPGHSDLPAHQPVGRRGRSGSVPEGHRRRAGLPHADHRQPVPRRRRGAGPAA